MISSQALGGPVIQLDGAEVFHVTEGGYLLLVGTAKVYHPAPGINTQQGIVQRGDHLTVAGRRQ